MDEKTYIAVVQCHIVKQRCSGYLCEAAFHDRTGGFSRYPAGTPYRTLHLTCGGCCGRALHRKLGNLVHKIAQKEGLQKSQIVVHLSSCITKDNYHGPPCPHLDYLKTLISKLGLDVVHDTSISDRSEERRKAGLYES